MSPTAGCALICIAATIFYFKYGGKCCTFKMTFSEEELIKLSNSAEIFNFLSDLPSKIEDFDALDLGSYENINRNVVEQERKRLVSQVLTDGSLFSNKTNSIRRVKKRSIKKKSSPNHGSILKSIFGDIRGPEDAKNKNVRQTGRQIIWELTNKILCPACL